MARQIENCQTCQRNDLSGDDGILNCSRYLNWQIGNPPCYNRSSLSQSGGLFATHDEIPDSYDPTLDPESVFPRISQSSLREEARSLRTQVETMRKEGKGIAQISAALGVSKKIIYGATTRLIKQGRIKPLYRTEEENREIMLQIEDLRKRGFSNQEIASALELRETSVEVLAHKLIVAGRIESRRKRK